MITPRRKSMNKTLIAVLVATGLVGVGGAAWGKSLETGTVFQDCPECPEVVVIPSGEFMISSPDSELDREDVEAFIDKLRAGALTPPCAA
jgi:formylglycine-generating enzyme required for sulfatase activity